MTSHICSFLSRFLSSTTASGCLTINSKKLALDVMLQDVNVVDGIQISDARFSFDSSNQENLQISCSVQLYNAKLQGVGMYNKGEKTLKGDCSVGGRGSSPAIGLSLTLPNEISAENPLLFEMKPTLLSSALDVVKDILGGKLELLAGFVKSVFDVLRSLPLKIGFVVEYDSKSVEFRNLALFVNNISFGIDGSNLTLIVERVILREMVANAAIIVPNWLSDFLTWIQDNLLKKGKRELEMECRIKLIGSSICLQKLRLWLGSLFFEVKDDGSEITFNATFNAAFEILSFSLLNDLKRNSAVVNLLSKLHCEVKLVRNGSKNYSSFWEITYGDIITISKSPNGDLHFIFVAQLGEPSEMLICLEKDMGPTGKKIATIINNSIIEAVVKNSFVTGFLKSLKLTLEVVLCSEGISWKKFSASSDNVALNFSDGANLNISLELIYNKDTKTLTIVGKCSEFVSIGFASLLDYYGCRFPAGCVNDCLESFEFQPKSLTFQISPKATVAFEADIILLKKKFNLEASFDVKSKMGFLRIEPEGGLSLLEAVSGLRILEAIIKTCGLNITLYGILLIYNSGSTKAAMEENIKMVNPSRVFKKEQLDILLQSCSNGSAFDGLLASFLIDLSILQNR